MSLLRRAHRRLTRSRRLRQRILAACGEERGAVLIPLLSLTTLVAFLLVALLIVVALLRHRGLL